MRGIVQNDNVSVLLNNGNGTLAANVTYNACPFPNSVAISDLDNDLDLNLAIAGNAGVSVLLNNGDATFTDESTYSAGNESPTSVAIGDLSDDANPDIAVTHNRGVSVLLNDCRLLGDVNKDGVVNLLDIDPFKRLSTSTFPAEADCNQDGVVNLLDVDAFIAILSGG